MEEGRDDGGVGGAVGEVSWRGGLIIALIHFTFAAAHRGHR